MSQPPAPERARRVGRAAVHVSPARSGAAEKFDVSLCWPAKRPVWSVYYVLSDASHNKAESTADLLREILGSIGEQAWKAASQPESDSQTRDRRSRTGE